MERQLAFQQTGEGGKVISRTWLERNGSRSIEVLNPAEWARSGGSGVGYSGGEGKMKTTPFGGCGSLQEFKNQAAYVQTDREGCGGSGVFYDGQGKEVHYETDGYGGVKVGDPKKSLWEKIFG